MFLRVSNFGWVHTLELVHPQAPEITVVSRGEIGQFAGD